MIETVCMHDLAVEMFNELYPDIGVTIIITNKTFHAGLLDSCVGVTFFALDWEPVIMIDGDRPLLDMMATMCHEFAHIIVGIEEKHNHVWKRKCDELLEGLKNKMVAENHIKVEQLTQAQRV